MIGVLTGIVFAVVVALGVIVALVVRKREKEGRSVKADYRKFYKIGLIMTPLGVIITLVYFLFQIPFFIGLPFLALGIVYLAIGLANRDKWRDSA